MKFIPAYLPAVGYLAALRNSDTLECCLHSHYEKQTYRNRCTIYGANGRLNLTVPVMHNSNGQRQTDLEMKIHYADNWQKIIGSRLKQPTAPPLILNSMKMSYPKCTSKITKDSWK